MSDNESTYESEEPPMIALTDNRDIAAQQVRRLVTPQVLQIIEEQPDAAVGIAEALVVCRNLRPGQHEAAIIAHRHLVRRMRHDLLDCGCAEPEHLELVNELQDYLDAEGWIWCDRQWLTDEEHEAALARRVAEAG
jgi:hypothetical protein